MDLIHLLALPYFQKKNFSLTANLYRCVSAALNTPLELNIDLVRSLEIQPNTYMHISETLTLCY